MIIDIRRDVIPSSDLQMIDYLAAVDVPCIPVLTKADKLSRSKRAQMKRIHAPQLPPEAQQVLFSAVTREGVAELSKRITDALT